MVFHKIESVDSVQKFTRAAAFLEREFSGRNLALISEAENENSSSNKIYVFDTNVFVRHSVGGYQKGSKGEYSGDQILPFFYGKLDKPKKETSRKLSQDAGAAIVSHIFDKAISKNIPLFQFPEHLTETESHFRYVKNEAGVLKTGLRDAENRDIFNLVGMAATIASYPNDQLESQPVQSVVEQLVTGLTGGNTKIITEREKSIRQWDAFLELNLRSGGIFPLDMYCECVPDSSELKNAFRFLDGQVESPKDQELLRDLISFWENELSKKKSGAIEKKIRADATSLAQLFIINSKLKDTKKSIVFVTHDKKLVETAYKADLSSIPNVDPKLAKSFARNQIRHVWAYASEAIVEPDRQDKFINWLTSIFATISRTGITSDKELSKYARGEAQLVIEIEDVVKAIEDWREITKQGISQFTLRKYGSDNDKFLKLRTAFLSKIESVRTSGTEQKFSGWESLIDELEELNDRFKDRAFLNLSNIGIEAVINASKVGQRNPPDLEFESLENTRNILKRLRTELKYTEEGAGKFERDYDKIVFDCHDSSLDGDDRQESHLKFLVLGAAFASANKWSLALSQAERAIWIVERSNNRRLQKKDIPTKDVISDEAKSNISGREAYFLASVAQRMVARSNSEFRRANDFLDNSILALKKDHGKGTAKNSNIFKYEAERLAISLAQYYFHRHSDETNLCEYWVHRVNERANRILELLAEYDDNQLGLHPKSSFKRRLGKVTLLNVCVNIIQVAAINKFRELINAPNVSAKKLDSAAIEGATEIVEDLLKTGSEDAARPHESFLIKVYKDLGKRLVMSEEGQSVAIGKLDSIYENVQMNSVSLYDTWRYLKLKELAELLSDEEHLREG